MANFARYESFAVDSAGNVLPSPTVEVRLESTGALAALKSDRTGLSAISNPFTGDSDGAFSFHVIGGAYKITVTKDAVTRTKRYVPIGTAAEFDSAGAAGETLASNFGVVGDSIVDDTANLQTAINNTPYGGTLRLPYGLCKIIGSGSACLTRTSAINIKGVGPGSGLYIDTSVPNTRDALRITPASADRGFLFEDFRIWTNSKGRHGIAFDGGALSVVYGIHAHRLIIDPTAGGQSIFGEGSTGGVFAYSTIANCIMDSVKVTAAGDGLTIENNTFDGAATANANVNITQTSGAGNLVVKKNVMVGTAGAVIVEQAVTPIIADNEIEQQATLTEANGAIIDINGGSAAIYKPTVTGNIINVSGAGTGVSSLIRLNAVLGGTVDNNWLGGKGSAHIVQTANALDVTIGAMNNAYTNNIRVPLALTDSGKRTKIITPEHFIALAANQTGADTANAQTWFPGGGPTAFYVLPNSAYSFEGQLSATKTAGTTARTVSQLFGGTAIISSIQYESLSGTADVSSFPITSSPLITPVEVSTATALVGSSSSANQAWTYTIRGIVRFGADLGSPAGTILTFIPQFKYSAAPGGAPTIRANSFFRMKLLGPDTVTNVGGS